ncbi:diacylglycerol kinase [Rhodobacteraceae bacterium]|nr:diacylglycerol kinase [Paracoccaceae bacterium]
MGKDTAKGVARLIPAFQNSISGFRDIWRRESAFRQEITTLVLSVPLATWLGNSLGHTGLLIGSILLLVIVEILNSAIEAIVDRIGPERHELSRIAKDLGSLAVVTTAIFPVFIWGASLLSWLGLISLS